MRVMRSRKRPLTCNDSHDADGWLCVILRHLSHPVTHLMTPA